jgi:hypothetical protein
LESRDYEILRTLARLHFLTSAEINQAFFSSEFAGYRRLRKLGGLNLIKRHNKGVPPRTNYCAWRITGPGIEALLRAHPDEPVPDGLDDRLARQSLTNLEHREAVSRLYLDAIRGADGVSPDGPSCATLRKWVARLRTRAGRFNWRSDGSVVLKFRDLGRRRRIVPDAVATTPDRRFFIELDRSNKTLPRIEENLREYRGFFEGAYREVCGDDLPAQLVYVVRSRARKLNIAKLAERVIMGRWQWKVLVLGPESASWLGSALVGDDPSQAQGADPAVEENQLLREARDLLASTSALLKHETRAFNEIDARSPTLVRAWKQSLRTLFYRLQAESPRGR